MGDTRARGHVVDPSGRSLEGVVVTVRAHLPPLEELGARLSELKPELPLIARTVTDERGWFQLDAFPPGVECDLRFDDFGRSAVLEAFAARAGHTEALTVPLEGHGFLQIEDRSRPRDEELEPFLLATSPDRPRASGLRVESLAGRRGHELPPGTWSVRLVLVHEGEIATWFGPWEEVEIEAGRGTEVTLALNERGRR